MDSNQSEVSRLLAQINSQYEAARRGLSGLASGISQHRFITKRTEHIAELHSQLRDLVGDEAMKQLENEIDQHDAPPQLDAIAQELRSTAQYAIDPAFRERLREDLLQQFRQGTSE